MSLVSTPVRRVLKLCEVKKRNSEASMAKTEARMSLKPLGDKVVVEVIDEPQTTASGIVLPDNAKEKSQRGTVVAVGPGKVLDNGEREPMDVGVGDTVVFAKYGGTELELGGKDYMILSLRDIHAIVE
jgi:chaperonin GroES